MKIDGSFVFDLASTETHQDSIKLIKAMINMAKALNMQVVAEGVEDLLTFDWLNDAGCYLMQGYYFYKPIPPHDLADYLSKQAWQEKRIVAKKEQGHIPLELLEKI